MERASILMQNGTNIGPRATFFGQKISKKLSDIFMIILPTLGEMSTKRIYPMVNFGHMYGTGLVHGTVTLS